MQRVSLTITNYHQQDKNVNRVFTIVIIVGLINDSFASRKTRETSTHNFVPHELLGKEKEKRFPVLNQSEGKVAVSHDEGPIASSVEATLATCLRANVSRAWPYLRGAHVRAYIGDE